MKPATRRLLAWLLPVLMLALALRLIGLGYGLPFPLIGGENALVGGALRMARSGEIIPALSRQMAHLLPYPVLLPWLYTLLAAPVLVIAWALQGFPGGHGLEWVSFENLSAVLLAARLTSVAFSVATVALVALTARRLFASSTAGAVAALLVATSWLSVVLAHSAGAWSATAFFIWLAAYIAMRYLSRPTVRRALLLGLASGLGFGASYLGAAGLAAGLLAYRLRHGRRHVGRNLIAMLAPVALCVVVFGASNWMALAQPAGTSTDAGGRLSGLLDTVLVYLRVGWWADPVTLVAGLLGLLVILWRRPGVVAVLVGGLLAWLVLLDLTLPPQQSAIMPALPLLALAAGGAAAHIEERLTWRRLLTGAVLGGLVLLYPIATSGWMSLLMASTDTRVEAADWLLANLPAGHPVVVDLGPVTVLATVDGLVDQQDDLPGTLDAAMRLALQTGWPAGLGTARLRAVDVGRVPPDQADEALFDRLRKAGYRTFAVAVSDDGKLTGLQHAVLNDNKQLAVFVASHAHTAPHVPDFMTGVLLDGPAWRLFLLDRLGRSVLIGDVPAP